MDRERGYILARGADNTDKQVPLMTLSMGVVTASNQFSDIREITEMAAEARRNDTV
nr:hypothetical protein [Chloroflexota bacterium]